MLLTLTLFLALVGSPIAGLSSEKGIIEVGEVQTEKVTRKAGLPTQAPPTRP